jgi:hypothetical protein
LHLVGQEEIPDGLEARQVGVDGGAQQLVQGQGRLTIAAQPGRIAQRLDEDAQLRLAAEGHRELVGRVIVADVGGPGRRPTDGAVSPRLDQPAEEAHDLGRAMGQPHGAA